MSSRAWGLIKDLASKFTIKIIQGEYDIKQVASSQRMPDFSSEMF